MGNMTKKQQPDQIADSSISIWILSIYMRIIQFVKYLFRSEVQLLQLKFTKQENLPNHNRAPFINHNIKINFRENKLKYKVVYSSKKGKSLF